MPEITEVENSFNEGVEHILQRIEDYNKGVKKVSPDEHAIDFLLAYLKGNKE